MPDRELDLAVAAAHVGAIRPWASENVPEDDADDGGALLAPAAQQTSGRPQHTADDAQTADDGPEALPAVAGLRPRTTTSTKEIDSTIARPGSVRINVKGAFIVEEDGRARSTSPATSAKDARAHSPSEHTTFDIRLPNHHAVVSHIAVDVSAAVGQEEPAGTRADAD